MRILFLTDKYWPSLGGVETVVRSLAQELASRGHQMRVLTVSDRHPALTFATYTYASGRPRTYPDGEIDVRVLGARPWQRAVQLPVALRYVPYLRSRAFGRLAEITLPAFRLAHQRTLNALARQSDLIHGHGAQYLGACGLAGARAAGIPFVITPYCHPGHWGDDPMNAATYRRADLVLGITETDAQTYLNLGVSPDRVAVVPNPVNAIPATEPHTEDLPYILYVGRVNTYKGIRRLFAAWRLVRQQIPAQLLVAGAAQEDDLDPPPGVTLLGPVDERHKAALLAGARAVVLPSRGELQGIVILEAWGHGVPVVVSDIPALASVVTHAVDGLVTPTDEASLSAALLRLLRDPASARRMGDAGRHRVAEHDPTAISIRLLGHYHRLLSTGPGIPALSPQKAVR